MNFNNFTAVLLVVVTAAITGSVTGSMLPRGKFTMEFAKKCAGYFAVGAVGVVIPEYCHIWAIENGYISKNAVFQALRRKY